MTIKRRWINTRVESVWDGKRYVNKVIKGYWYQGPMALAHNTAAFEQTDFQWREDDGSESAATNIGAVNEYATAQLPQVTANPNTVNKRIRFNIRETNGGSQNNYSVQLQVRVSVNMTWTNLTDTNFYNGFGVTTHYTDLDNTTEQIAQSGTFLTPNNGMSLIR